jgi:hypothetical protein
MPPVMVSSPALPFNVSAPSSPKIISIPAPYVLCRAKTGSQVFNTKSGKITPIDVPTAGARLTGGGNELRLVWTDTQGVWSAVPPQRKAPRKVAPWACPLTSRIGLSRLRHAEPSCATVCCIDQLREKRCAQIHAFFSRKHIGYGNCL